MDQSRLPKNHLAQKVLHIRERGRGLASRGVVVRQINKRQEVAVQHIRRPSRAPLYSKKSNEVGKKGGLHW